MKAKIFTMTLALIFIFSCGDNTGTISDKVCTERFTDSIFNFTVYSTKLRKTNTLVGKFSSTFIGDNPNILIKIQKEVDGEFVDLDMTPTITPTEGLSTCFTWTPTSSYDKR